MIRLGFLTSYVMVFLSSMFEIKRDCSLFVDVDEIVDHHLFKHSFNVFSCFQNYSKNMDYLMFFLVFRTIQRI